MTHKVRKFTRVALWMLPVWTVLLFWTTLTEQPDPLTAFADFAAYVTTSHFLVSHVLGSIAGAAIGSIGMIGLMLYLQETRAAGIAIAGTVATVAGNILMSSIYGVAAFAEPAMGRLYQAGEQGAIEFYKQAYAAPLFGTALTGMLLFIVGGVFTGFAIAGSRRLPGWSGWVYAMMSIGFALGLFLGPMVQTISSALLIIATLAVAWRAGREDARLTERIGIATAD